MTDRPELISVILSTYNSPSWLAKVLCGYQCQSHRSFEIVVADDGSTHKTRQLIDDFRCQSGMSIIHVWHPDDGFQKCAILNRAIQEASGDYFVFSDGDCIPRSDFLHHHFVAAERGRFLSGGYYKLPMSTSEAISEDDIRNGNAFRIAWLRTHDLPFSHRMIRLASKGWHARLLNRITTTKPTWNGNNSSGWADDIRSANGFDERMRYGGEDRELGERLENAGIRGKHIRYQSVVLHLDHARGYVNDDRLKTQSANSRRNKTNARLEEFGIRNAA